MSERKEGLEAKSSELASEISVLRSFIDHAGWRMFQPMLKVQADTRLDPQPLERMDQVLEQEFKKGEAAAFRLIARMPDVMLEQAQQQLEKLQKEIEDEAIYEQRLARPDGGSTDRRSAGWGGTERTELLDPDTDPFGSV